MGIIKRPIITEKATSLEENRQYGFVVENSADKAEIKEAIETLYGVKVEGVNTMRYAGKKKRNRKTYLFDGRTNSFKKAVVTVAEGDVIDFYS